MTFWQFLDKRWPSERAWTVILLSILIASLLKMADHDPALWQVELFKTLLTASIITGGLNMVLPYHFSANKDDADKTANTAKAFEAITAAAGDRGNAVANAANQVADAAGDEADRITRPGDRE